MLTITDDASSDPQASANNNDVKSLLTSNDVSVPLMMGLTITAPPAILSDDKLAKFNISDRSMLILPAEKPFPDNKPEDDNWLPAHSNDGEKQWDDVLEVWTHPLWGVTAQQVFVDTWIDKFRWKTKTLDAKLPELLGRNFKSLYMVAPMISVESSRLYVLTLT